ncbi:MAG: hypothetical protein R2787_11920 [Saprospiraceae bacterium]|nr:hypothetical protein [Saprospiraceae bacterium]MCB9312959.1 hypothetical protein [Lewinellaceae bacterium]HRW75347.1 hypothetical protein [Saprospiraceae bacterium]
MGEMDNQKIRDLLQRYFEAETDVAEERQLKTYFKRDQIEPEFEVYRDLFVLSESDRQIEISPDFEARVLSGIKPAPVVRLSVRRFLAVAASITVLVLAGWWIWQQNKPSSQANMAMEDTFEDPEEAYRQVTAALALMSSTMEKGQQMTIQSVAPAQELNVIQMN